LCANSIYVIFISDRVACISDRRATAELSLKEKGGKMRSLIHAMEKRYNRWKERPLAVPVATSAQAVLRRASGFGANGSSCSCRASCGGECKVQSCTSCKVD